jgi:CheY-like chemotaxis protein
LPWLDERASDTPDAREERLAALGLVTAGVVHEINNPLATIILNLGELRKQLPARLDGHAQELLDDTIEAAERIRLIVRDVQDFARARDRDGVGIEVQQVLESALRLVRHLLNDRATVVKRYAPAPLVVAADGRLGQLFVNLLVNAAQAIPEGRARDNTLTVSTATSSVGDCVVTIADTGVGIAPDHLEHIFDLFFTTKPADTGTGLGLPLCQAIVASLGGRIEVTSVPGKGSAFRVVLPAATPATLSALGARAVSDASAVVPRRVLVIDDDELLARALVRGLAPHHVEVALRARAGLEALLADDGFDMVLCDLVMPDGSGIELYQELRVKRPGLERRIVFMSAAHGGSVVEAAGGMTNRIVYKPFDVSELRRLLERNLS